MNIKQPQLEIKFPLQSKKVKLKAMYDIIQMKKINSKCIGPDASFSQVQESE